MRDKELDRGESRRQCMEVALGTRPADVVFIGASVVDVYTNAVYAADIAVQGGRIAYVGDCRHTIGESSDVVDLTGSVLTPGFIDGHTHIGAAQFSMTNLARSLVARGTFNICVDFHIPGIVGGLPAIRHLLDELARTPLTPLFTVGYQMYTQNGPLWNTKKISGADLLAALDWPETVGISEWLLWFYVRPELHPPEMQTLFEEVWRRGLLHVGHAHSYPTRDLQAYTSLAASSDHEAISVDEIVERLKLGLHVMLRTDYTSRLMPEIIKRNVDTRNMSWSTDGLSGPFVHSTGHIDSTVRTAIKAGLDPIRAVQMASLNAAEYFGLSEERGSLTPGRLANIVVIDNLEDFNVTKVFARGSLVAQDGQYIADLAPPARPQEFLRTMNVGRSVAASDFLTEAPRRDRVGVRVIGLADPITKTVPMEFTLPVVDGYVSSDAVADVNHIAVVDRNLSTGAIGNCFIHGLGIKRGAFGITSTGGAADIGVLGTNPHDMSVVVNHLVEIGGGAAVAIDGIVVASVPMPVLGLFSDKPIDEVLCGIDALEKALALMEPKVPLFRALRFSALPRAVPSWKVCQRGLCDVGPFTAELLPLFLEH